MSIAAPGIFNKNFEAPIAPNANNNSVPPRAYPTISFSGGAKSIINAAAINRTHTAPTSILFVFSRSITLLSASPAKALSATSPEAKPRNSSSSTSMAYVLLKLYPDLALIAGSVQSDSLFRCYSDPFSDDVVITPWRNADGSAWRTACPSSPGEMTPRSQRDTRKTRTQETKNVENKFAIVKI